MLRTSSYTIYVDLPGNDSEMLLVHGYSGAYDKVSRRVVDYLRCHEARRPPKPLYGDWSPEPETDKNAEPLPDSTISVLRQRGYLTHLSCEDEEVFFGKLAAQLHQRAIHTAPSYVFIPTYDCNLRCSYCFQDHMRTDCSFKHLLRTMRPAMADRIFDAMPWIEKRHGIGPGGEHRRNIGLFGGEPLLAAHRPVIEHILRRAGNARIWAVTNATELDAYSDLLGPGKIDELQVTLDGPPEEHDRRRVHADGSGSFGRIAENVTMALEHGAAISIRLNVDRNNLGHLPGLADEIFARGWSRYPRFSAYTATINATGEASSENGDRRHLMNSWQLDQALTEMRRDHPHLEVLGRPDEALRLRARRIFARDEQILPQLKPSFCAAHSQMYIFDPFGDIYACWERTGDARIRIGRIAPDSSIELVFDRHDQWRSRSVASNPVCKRCRYALHCGGGCAILALGQRGKFHSNYCDGFASRFRASVAEAYKAHVAGDKVTSQQERVCDL